MWRNCRRRPAKLYYWTKGRSEEHTSELQSQSNLVCRLLLEKKITINPVYAPPPPHPLASPGTVARLPRLPHRIPTIDAFSVSHGRGAPPRVPAPRLALSPPT